MSAKNNLSFFYLNEKILTLPNNNKKINEQKRISYNNIHIRIYNIGAHVILNFQIITLYDGEDERYEVMYKFILKEKKQNKN